MGITHTFIGRNLVYFAEGVEEASRVQYIYQSRVKRGNTQSAR